MMKSKPLQLALGIGLGMGMLVASQAVMADKSAALKRAEQAAGQVDVSDYIDKDSDGLSRSIFLGREPVAHEFEVDQPGDYIISARGFRGESGDYDVNGVLKDSQGNELAHASGNQQSHGFSIEHSLAPGKYSVVITGQTHSPVREGSQTVTVTVRNAEDDRTTGLADNERVQQLKPAGREQASTAATAGAVSATTPGIGSSERSASKVTSPEQGVPRPGPSGQALEQAANGTDDTVRAASDTAQSEEAALPARSSIAREVPIRENGEVMTFDVVQAGTVQVKSSTFGADAGSYRLAAEIRDAQGRVVASDAGQGLQGDFAIKQQLDPGRYTVYVKGQKFGSAQSGVNSYTLRVEQLN